MGEIQSPHLSQATSVNVAIARRATQAALRGNGYRQSLCTGAFCRIDLLPQHAGMAALTLPQIP
jgi:hypothetical protein